jgi:hypothetical protein
MYHLVFKGRPESPVRSVTFYGESPAVALELARRQDGPAEFWIEGKFICTLSRVGEHGEIWVITGDREAASERLAHDLAPQAPVQAARSA